MTYSPVLIPSQDPPTGGGPMVERDPNETLQPEPAEEEAGASGVTGNASGEQPTETAESAPETADDPTALSETGSDASSATQETPSSATTEEASTSDSQVDATTPAAETLDAESSGATSESDQPKHDTLMHPNSVTFARRGETFKDVIARAVAELKTDISDEVEWHKANQGAFQGVDPNLPLPESMRLNVPNAKLHD